MGIVQAIGLVMGGTLLGTALRCGFKALRQTIVLFAKAIRKRFDPDQTRSILAYHAARIRKDGVLRASERSCADPDIDACIRLLVQRRSVAALQQAAKGKHQEKAQHRDLARQTLENAGELAPVMGLAGTLLALSQLPSGGLGADGLMPTVAIAVQTTLLGLALAHLVFHPLARWIDRRVDDELQAREALLDWFVGQIEHAVPDKPKTQDILARNPPPPANQSLDDDWAA